MAQTNYKKRWISNKMRKALNVSKVIILTGARQTGKTTLLRNEPPFAHYKYFTMDNLDTLAQAEKDPYPLLSVGKNIVIDEVQRVPKVLLAIKQIVDENKDYRFILSGSANFLLIKNISETLAGRASYFKLYPFAYSEVKGENIPEWFINFFQKQFPVEKEVKNDEDVSQILFRGFLPPLLDLHDPEEISIWWDGYIKTYLERDLRDLSNVSSLADFRNLMELLTLRTGSVIDQTGLSGDTGISQPTIHRYINLLETSHLFVKLRPFVKSKSKRITKRPKGYFIDSGLAAHLSGIRNPTDIDGKFKGHLFESMILENLLAISDVLGIKIYFWRIKNGREVDFVLEYGRKVLAIEVKLSNKAKYEDIQNLLHFIDETPNALGGILIYNGNKIQKLTANVFAIPWTML